MERLNLSKFMQLLSHAVSEIGSADMVSSHPNCKPSLSVCIDGLDDDNEYEVVDVQPEIRLGCGCWDGVEIVLRKKVDKSV